MWKQLDMNDTSGLTRVIDLLHRMDFRYLWVDVPSLRSKMKHGLVEAFLYRSASLDVAMVFYPEPRRKRRHICVAFDGTEPPAKVADIVVPKVKQYIADQSLPAIYGIRPKQIQNRALAQFHQLIFSHPGVAVTVVSDMADSQILKMESMPIAAPVSP